MPACIYVCVCIYECKYVHMCTCVHISGAGEMAQKLSTLTVLPDSLSSVFSTHIIQPPSGSLAPAHLTPLVASKYTYLYMCAKPTYT